ncbi:hypothetical protein ACJBU6_08446 [Exserohilum turcicum]
MAKPTKPHAPSAVEPPLPPLPPPSPSPSPSQHRHRHRRSIAIAIAGRRDMASWPATPPPSPSFFNRRASNHAREICAPVCLALCACVTTSMTGLISSLPYHTSAQHQRLKIAVPLVSPC